MSYQRDGSTIRTQPTYQQSPNQRSSRTNRDAQPGAPDPSLHPSQRQQPSRPLRPEQGLNVSGLPRPAANRGTAAARTIPQYRQDVGPPMREYGPQDSVNSWVAEVSPTNPSLDDVPRPFAENQRDSTGSSVYSVPDFPLPQAPQVPQQVARPSQQSNRRPPLGPPPSARRGPASYYPQANYVSPIVEETDSQRGLHDSKSSFASSNAIPIGISSHLANQHDVSQNINSPFQDQYEDSDNSEPEQLRPIPVRQASIGRKSTPVLTTIKSDSVRPDSQTRPLHHNHLQDSTQQSRRLGSSDDLTQYLASEKENVSVSSLEISEKDASPNLGKQTTLAERVGSKRPPRLNVDAVREAEARGSLTSLPDLIRRATKVASNLDRGRTASRLGLNFFDDDVQKSHETYNRRSGSLSDILASFPPPGLATPGSGRGSGMGSRSSRAMPWSSNLHHSSLPSESDFGEEQDRRHRRCCGMPLWLFFTLLLLVVVLVAAAVIIPIVLVVVPQQESARNSAAASALATCQKSLDCKNGGINIVGSDGSCSCLCVNGFAGSECTQASSASCTTTNIGSVKNVTLGDSIPRLLTSSEANFSIPLNASNILGLFASSKLTCTSENALVTFNGLSARSTPQDIFEAHITLSPTKALRERADLTTVAGAAVTSNGIVFASGSASDVSSSTSSDHSSTSSTSASQSLSSSPDLTTLDFARIAVLFVFQESGQISNAIAAQENLQSYFTSGTTSTGQQINASSIDLGASMSADLEKRSVTLSNGTVIGGG